MERGGASNWGWVQKSAGPPALPDIPEELPAGLQVCQPIRGGPPPTDC